MRKVKVFNVITYAQQQKLANDILFKESGLVDRFKFPQPTQEARDKVAPPLRAFRCMGLFHQWGTESDGEVAYTVAIVELEDGSVITPWFKKVQFVVDVDGDCDNREFADALVRIQNPELSKCAIS